MRLSLSRPEVDLILKLLEAERFRVKDPSDKLVNRFLSLKHKFLEFRNQVWDTEYKEV